MTMLKVYDVIREIEKVAPKEYALDFDNIGLLIGNEEREVTGILCCLDLTKKVIDEAYEKGANLIVSHHPFIFDPLKQILTSEARGKLISLAIKRDLNVYSAHTNWDFAKGGVNCALIDKLELKDVRKGFGDLKEALDIESLLKYLKDKLNLKSIRYIVPLGLEDKPIKRLGVSAGALCDLDENDIDGLVTGEVKHSEAIDLNLAPFVSFVVGHYESEIFGVKAMKEVLSSKFSKKTRVFMSETETNPFKYS